MPIRLFHHRCGVTAMAGRRLLLVASLFLGLAGVHAADKEAPAIRRNVDKKDWDVSGSHGAVAAGGAGAVNAGIILLKAGGNAADAAAATMLALSVTDDTNYC